MAQRHLDSRARQSASVDMVFASDYELPDGDHWHTFIRPQQIA
ncbi:MAG: hypothetical protein ABI557_12210 [Aureliella sp.]